MIAVMVAKVISATQNCTVDSETNAPCNWWLYWTWGARIGVIVVPTIAIWRMRRGRRRRRENE